LVTSIPEGINWLMPTLREAMETGVYCKESFIYLHKFDNKVYLEIVKPNQLFNLVQKFDKIYSCTIVQEDEVAGRKLVLYRDIKLEDGKSFITLRAAEMDKYNKEEAITINKYNSLMGTDYKSQYILGYEVIINLDLGQDFFRDSKKLLIECTRIMDILNDELEKTRTRIATTNHYQTGNVLANWKPVSNYQVEQLSVGKLADYFTLMPGDKDHQMFQFLQGNVRVQEYISTFKFYDYQVIQMAGLSPSTFGYEKDTYQNVDSVDLNINTSEMTIEAIKTQIEPQINKLLENIVKMQNTQDIQEELLPAKLEWDYGSNERLDDFKKIKILKLIQNVASIPYTERAKIIAPILAKIQDIEVDEKTIQKLVEERNEERGNIRVEYGEI
jgi:hypothetical protein